MARQQIISEKSKKALFCAGCSYQEGSEHCTDCFLKAKFMKEQQVKLSKKNKAKTIVFFVLAAFMLLITGLAFYVTADVDMTGRSVPYWLGAHSVELIFAGLAVFFLVKGMRCLFQKHENSDSKQDAVSNNKNSSDDASFKPPVLPDTDSVLLHKTMLLHKTIYSFPDNKIGDVKMYPIGMTEEEIKKFKNEGGIYIENNQPVHNDDED